ncbi:MAG: polyprenol monophosphomannose synthase [Candidatus Bathyarchaeota archaeon]|nr:polyprenol monophosphomannose synthase [Candidatus Bathyarchaeota archaeon]
MVYTIVGNAANSEIGVILPTYGEADNISRLIEDIENLHLNTSILVIDDSSPDGTAEIVLDKQKQHPNVVLCSRPKKSGLGTAITDGFRYYLCSPNPPRYVFTMDADYSHNPQDIPKLLATMRECNCAIVIGSRYSKGGQIQGWPLSRKIISKAANTIAQTALGLELNDCTSGFRCYSTEFLKKALTHLHSHTYEIQIETVRQAALNDFRVKETPIVFVNRKKGKSKLTWTEIKSYISYTVKAALTS